MNIYKEMCIEENKERYYFVTVRPDSKVINFLDFKNIVEKYISKKTIILYNYSFEQKGISEETLGEGFHVHIIAHMKQRSKGEVLRDTISTFKSCCAANCIQVDLCKNPEETISNYLVDYKSKDDHKIITKEWDTLWRNKNNLLGIYSNEVNNLSSPSVIEIL